MLTGSGVALILRVVGTPPDDHWTTYALVRVRGRRRAVAAVQVRHPLPRLARVQPVEHRPRRRLRRARQRRASSRSTSGGRRSNVLDARRLRRDPRRRAADHAAAAACSALAASFWVDPRGRRRPARRLGPLHDGELVVRAGLRLRLLAGDRHLARGHDLPVLHDHRPEDRAGRAGRAGRLRRRSSAIASTLLMAPQTDEFGTKVGLLAGLVVAVRGPADPRPHRCRRRTRPPTTCAGSRRRLATGGEPAGGSPGARRASVSPPSRSSRSASAIVAAGTPARGTVVADSAEILNRPADARSIRRPCRRSRSARTSSTSTTSSAGPGCRPVLVTLAQNLELENQALLRRDRDHPRGGRPRRSADRDAERASQAAASGHGRRRPLPLRPDRRPAAGPVRQAGRPEPRLRRQAGR